MTSSFTLTLTETDAANLRAILSGYMSRDPVVHPASWRAEAGRLWQLVGDARDAANPADDKSAAFRPAAA